MVTLAAISGAVVVVLLGIGVATSITAAQRPAATGDGVDAPEVADGAESESEIAGGQPEASLPPTAEDEPPFEFASVSGNIRCRADATTLICHQGDIRYPEPPQDCKTGPAGATVGLTTTGTTWPCLSADFQPAYILPYDTELEHGDFTCLINYEAGIRCENSRGEGFTLEYYAGIRTY